MKKMSADSRPARPPSAMEQEAFRNHSLSVERFIDGFIMGLEAAGMERRQLTAVAEQAINSLLGIRQSLMEQRAAAAQGSRTLIRKMNRHLKETALLVEEYILAITEECAKSHRELGLSHTSTLSTH